LKDKRVDFEER